MNEERDYLSHTAPIFEVILKEVLIIFLLKRVQILNICRKYLESTFKTTLYAGLGGYVLSIVILGSRGALSVIDVFVLFVLNLLFAVLTLTSYRFFIGMVKGVEYLHGRTVDLSVHGRLNFFELNHQKEPSEAYKAVDELLGFTPTWEEQMYYYLNENEYKPEHFSIMGKALKISERKFWRDLIDYFKQITHEFHEYVFDSEDRNYQLEFYNLTAQKDPGTIFVEITKRVTKQGRLIAISAYGFLQSILILYALFKSVS